MSRATSARSVSRSTLKATSGGLTASSTAPALGCSAEGPARGAISPEEGGRRAVPGPGRESAPGERRYRAPVPEHRHPQHGDAAGQHPRRPLRAGVIGVETHEGHHVGRPHPRVHPAVASQVMRATATAMPAASASTSCSGAPTTVNTERLWSRSECTSSTLPPASAIARPIASTTSASLPCEKLGTDSSDACTAADCSGGGGQTPAPDRSQGESAAQRRAAAAAATRYAPHQ